VDDAIRQCGQQHNSCRYVESNWDYIYDQLTHKGKPDEISRDHPDVSPANGPWTGVCPFIITFADGETLRDDGALIAKNARAAGVAVQVVKVRVIMRPDLLAFIN
jgi:acetyl esterase/lipase